MRRVLVIGISGAGKSTFARVLAQKTGLPLIHLDREFWQPGWRATPRDTWRARVARLVSSDAWIMDGSYGASLDIRLPRADTVVWFDYPRLRCLARVAWRIATTYGKVRPDLAPGCPEQVDWEFLRYVWDFNTKSRPQIVRGLAEHGGHVNCVVVRRDADAARFIVDLPAGRD
jgi:adenylate kinase family enzyme